jgi:hypothetical protein
LIRRLKSPVRRTNAGRFGVDHPGDYATLNSYHPVDGTRWAHVLFYCRNMIVLHQQEGPTHHEGNYVVSTRPVTGQWENDHCRMAAC